MSFRHEFASHPNQSHITNWKARISFKSSTPSNPNSILCSDPSKQRTLQGFHRLLDILTNYWRSSGRHVLDLGLLWGSSWQERLESWRANRRRPHPSELHIGSPRGILCCVDVSCHFVFVSKFEKMKKKPKSEKSGLGFLLPLIERTR